MADGATYPAEFQEPDGSTRIGGKIHFTDSDDQPSGPTQQSPFKPGVDQQVDIVVDSDGDQAYYFDDDGHLHSWDGDARFEGDVDMDGDADVTGTLTLGTAAAAGGQVQRADQMTSGLGTIAAGTLPDTGAWVSGTAKANPTVDPGRQITVNVEVVTDGTANAATCAIDISPNGTDFTTIGTPTASAAVNTVGAVKFLVPVTLPAGWSIKLTFSHCTVAASFYY